VASLLDDLPADELAFRFSSGRLCLDFVATVGERWRRSFERLRAPEDLGRWFVEALMLDVAPRVGRHELDEARELREAIYRLAKPGGPGVPSAGDLDAINRWAAQPPLAPQLRGDGRTVSWGARHPTRASLATIARDTIDLVSGPWAARVRECAAPVCALLFVDTSRPGQRRWCSMKACGNRSKTAAYRRRRAASRGQP
jgi:predicted RNA-binding Zn ribbon-like protein